MFPLENKNKSWPGYEQLFPRHHNSLAYTQPNLGIRILQIWSRVSHVSVCTHPRLGGGGGGWGYKAILTHMRGSPVAELQLVGEVHLLSLVPREGINSLQHLGAQVILLHYLQPPVTLVSCPDHTEKRVVWEHCYFKFVLPLMRFIHSYGHETTVTSLPYIVTWSTHLSLSWPDLIMNSDLWEACCDLHQLFLVPGLHPPGHTALPLTPHLHLTTQTCVYGNQP